MHSDREDGMNRLQIPERQEPTAAWIERRRDHLLAELGRQPARERRRRRFVLVLVPAIIVLLGATAFTTFSLTREARHLESVGCYDRADLAANAAIVSANSRSPIAICGEVWQQGALGKPIPPRLEACVLGSGAIAVFPGPAGTCGRLGLAPLPASYAAAARRFGALRDEIVAKLGTPASGAARRGPQCVGEAQAVAFVHKALSRHGYRGWKVRIAGGHFSSARPCAEPSFDTGAKTVYLIPARR
jgi:hypothetical protein